MRKATRIMLAIGVTAALSVISLTLAAFFALIALPRAIFFGGGDQRYLDGDTDDDTATFPVLDDELLNNLTLSNSPYLGASGDHSPFNLRKDCD